VKDGRLGGDVWKLAALFVAQGYNDPFVRRIDILVAVAASAGSDIFFIFAVKVVEIRRKLGG
jgi:hypothetical protein